MNMRRALCGCLMLAGLSYAGDDVDKEKKKVLDGLQGEWKAEKVLLGGKDIAENLQKQSFVFTAKEIMVREDDKETDNKSKFTIDISAKPPLIDVVTKEGDTLEGIFELKGDGLKICVSLQKGNRPTEFKSPDDSMVVLAEMKRVKK